MRLTKDGSVYEITDTIQIKAFLNSGWVSIDGAEREEIPAPALEPETRRSGRPKRQEQDEDGGS